ncbi:hydrogenase expression/formation protein [Desulfocurvibacter africanus PCS]|uniref:Hydrogenase expression/formation protein n=1 Tax=Desulfocurvibacter africanus PCS TaxID=1262666 RepID=M5PXN9_DESAF|nr:HyaD/HybD family hydrogenase maturation endopeptidase [Desulfocurvibacter africanus]EMG38745.1 hydrogenase expression/formation protein [Desulfocurvibacter africanus PCS]
MVEIDRNILVLGVGNILFTDEGVGVRLVERLQAEYDFSENVTLMDGGTLGTRLMDPIMASKYLVVVDAVLGDDAPGSIYRLTGDDLRKSLAFKNSLHQTDLVDTLIYCDILGNRPEAVIVGIEPHDYKTMAVDLSDTIQTRMPDLMAAVLAEVAKAGGSCTLKMKE